MNTLQRLLAITLLAASTMAQAGDYACPADSDTHGGWTPQSCAAPATVTTVAATTAHSDYACPTASDARGGWLPLSCAPAKVACAACGVVEAVNKVETEEASGLGAVAGAVAGGLLGHQVGKGKGKTIATIAGAVGGGVAGHYGEKLLRKKTRWDVVILMEDSTHKTVSFDAEPPYQAGDKVKVSGDALVKN